MSESTMSERDWRFDQVDGAPSDLEPEPFTPLGSTAAPCPRTRRLTLWSKRAARWARAQAGRFMGFSEVSREEEIVHELGRFLEGCSDLELIEKSFMESVGRLTAARSVQWIRGPVHPSSAGAGDGDGDGRLEIMLRAGSVARGRLLVLPPFDQPSAWSPATVKRLKTLCTMAASALLRHDWQNAELSQPAGRDLEPIPNALAITSARTDRDLDETKTKENHFAAAVFQDATFLHAILPFAVGLSRRHGEPLSLLCLAIDRLSGIHELLGRDWADRAIRNVGAHIAAMIRDSDIVARLDDDRIIVVLPRALIPHAWNLARKICRTVETTPALLAELPVLTVSIGVAEFPACASNVYALLDAADHALSMARNQGRNQAVAAATLNPTDPVNHACCAS
ncbi:MAG: diguanylate cyclase domain-containing protein [Isosphaeraceae bacterium]